VLARLLALVVLAACALACSTSDGEPGDGGGDERKDASRDGAKDARNDASGTLDGGNPYLVELSVTATTPSDAASALGLVPPFSPTINDYYVRCPAETNVLRVSMTASLGSESLVLQPIPSALAPKQTVVMGVVENQAIVSAAADGTATNEYWVRCLPHDFPQLQMTPHPEAGAPTPGYYLVGNLLLQPGERPYAMVLDGHGVPVWYSSGSGGNAVYDVDNIVDGAISFAIPFQVQTLSPFTTTFVTGFGLEPDEHELQVLPNGDYLVFYSSIQTGVDLTGLVLPLTDGGTQSFGANGSILTCDIAEIDSAGNIVWSWIATEHFDPVKDIAFPQPVELWTDAGPVAEPFHCNSIDVDTNGNLLVSARDMNSVFYVEYPSGTVLWKMGGLPYSKDPQTTYVPVPDPFYAQHDARLQPGWKTTCSGSSGQISLFDDHSFSPMPARAVVYDVTIAADGGTPPDCGPPSDAGATGATVAWQYAGDASVLATGSFRILPDGTRIIGWGTNPSIVFTEVDDAGHDLLDFHFTNGDTSYRAIKVPLSAFSLSELRSTSGL
jgi:arylsulfotransferase ASST